MAAPLLPRSPALILDAITMHAGVIVLQATTIAQVVDCPECRCPTRHVHSRYQRALLDLPWQGQAVRIQIQCRKLFCNNPECPKKIFTEPLANIAQKHARKTQRLEEALQELVYLAGAEAAARIAQTFGLILSSDCLLDQIQKAPEPDLPTPRVLGVDDFAFKRGRRYGTILIDLERCSPVDLLADRGASLADWLVAHPGIEIVTRDRSTEYTKAITQGAPEAIQVADRFHLLMNLRETLEKVADRHQRRLKDIRLPIAGEKAVSRPRAPEKRSEIEQALWSARHEVKTAQQQQIRALHEQGVSIRAIARRLGLARGTVYRYLRLEEAGLCPFPKRSGSRLDRYVPYLCQRFEQGCHNGVQLWREIKQRGYLGSRRMVAVWIAQQRPQEPCRQETAQMPCSGRAASSRQVSWFLLREEESLSLLEQAALQSIVEACPDLAVARSLAHRFRALVRERAASLLEAWLRDACASGVIEMKSFASGLLKDESAVRAGLSLEWSNGPVEGQVNRLKFVKRQGYGRAGFALLRRRVLPLAA